LAVFDTLGISNEPTISLIIQYLRNEATRQHLALSEVNPHCRVTHHILANNATAVDAAGAEAERLGYSHAMISANKPEGAAEDVGRHLAAMAQQMRGAAGPDCLISGGEPTVTLVDESRRGTGGRNQQLALAALLELGDCQGVALLSAGTDGEDGPTDAAGAFVTEDVARTARRLQLNPSDFLARNDAYHFFQNAGGLFVTGPTHTNVCDLRIVLVSG
jgi:glycerate-2-kinase